MLRAVALSAALVALHPGEARSAWLRPVRGPVVERFTWTPAHAYARGVHRGIALRAQPGTPVRAACAGPVAFAGRVGRAGPTVSVRCGALRATYQGVAEVAVAAGETVRAGDVLARVGDTGSLRLGARREAGGYADPAALLAGPAPPLGPAPPPRAPHARRRIRPVPPSLPAPGRPAPAARAPATPPLAWAGLALLAAAVPAGGVLRRARRRRLRARTAALRA